MFVNTPLSVDSFRCINDAMQNYRAYAIYTKNG